MEMFLSERLLMVLGRTSWILALKLFQIICYLQTTFVWKLEMNDVVANKLVNGSWQWVWARENIGSRNSSRLDGLRNEIQNVSLSDRDDSWRFDISSDGLFSVNIARKAMDLVLLSSTNIPTVWYKFIPRKVNIFLWRFRIDSLPLRWNLSAKGLELNSIVCPVCNNGIEMRSHLFFGCSLASELWHKVRVWLDCNMPFFYSWVEVVSWIESLSSTSSSKHKIVAVTATLLWVIWRFRNGIVFNEHTSRNSLFDVTRLFSFRWLKNRGHVVSNWNTWLSFPL
ncbi:uncharacterized protein [Rutidosis leptorrhynchoides]|uniref:uncharacterized protein n=1 Tax=Rutidosis leptorrhynchoides TaxID=125765 RepID=UPI003A9995F7